jgi:hypothetical protein
MPDRMTSTLKTDIGTIIYRPSPISGYQCDICDITVWWEQWKTFMFRTPVLVKGVVAPSVFAILETIPRSKYPALSENEEELSIPLQTLCLAIFDSALIFLLSHVMSSAWQPLKWSLHKALYEDKVSSCVSILQRHYSAADIIFIQEASEAFASKVWTCLDHFVMRPGHMDGKRSQMSVILLRRARFSESSCRDVTDEVLQRLKCVERGDLCVAEALEEGTGRPHLLVSFHGDSSGRATCPVLTVVHALVQERYPAHVVVLGLDANTACTSALDAARFGEHLRSLGLSACWTDAEAPHVWTTFSARTFLQPQLQKAVGHAQVLDRGNMHLKDWVLFYAAQLASAGADRDNTGGAGFEERVIPSHAFPSDHAIVRASLWPAPDPRRLAAALAGDVRAALPPWLRAGEELEAAEEAGEAAFLVREFRAFVLGPAAEAGPPAAAAAALPDLLLDTIASLRPVTAAYDAYGSRALSGLSGLVTLLYLAPALLSFKAHVDARLRSAALACHPGYSVAAIVPPARPRTLPPGGEPPASAALGAGDLLCAGPDGDVLTSRGGGGGGWAGGSLWLEREFQVNAVAAAGLLAVAMYGLLWAACPARQRALLAVVLCGVAAVNAAHGLWHAWQLLAAAAAEELLCAGLAAMLAAVLVRAERYWYEALAAQGAVKAALAALRALAARGARGVSAGRVTQGAVTGLLGLGVLVWRRRMRRAASADTEADRLAYDAAWARLAAADSYPAAARRLRALCGEARSANLLRGGGGDAVQTGADAAPAASVERVLAQARGADPLLRAKVLQWALCARGCLLVAPDAGDGPPQWARLDAATPPRGGGVRRVAWAAPKSAARAECKAARAGGGAAGAGRVLDAARQRAAFDSVADLVACADAALRDGDVVVEAVRDRLDAGYDPDVSRGYR